MLTATIAAYRAGQAPHIAQIFEVGTGTMLAAGKAAKQVWELAKETGVTIDPKVYIPVGARLLQPGRRAHGLDAVQLLHRGDVVQQGRVPQGRARSGQAAGDLGRGRRTRRRRIKAKNAAEIPMTTAWLDLDPARAIQRPAQHPFATKADGFEGLDAELKINSQPHVKHVARLLEMAKDGTFKYAGRDNAARPLLVSGQAGIHFDSSGMRGDLVKNAKFDWARGVPAVRSGDHQEAAELDHRRRQPVDDDRAEPHTGGIQGGRAIPEFIGKPENDADLASAHRLCAGHLRRLRTVEAAGLLREEPRRRPAGGAARPAAP